MTHADAVKVAKKLKLSDAMCKLLDNLYDHSHWTPKHVRVDGRIIEALSKRGLASAHWKPFTGWTGRVSTTGRELAAGLACKGEPQKDDDDHGLGYMQGRGAA